MTRSVSRKLITFAAGTALFGIVGGRAGAQSAPERVIAASDSIAAVLRADSVPGLAIAVYHASEPVVVRAYGYADLAQLRRLRTRDPIEVASVTKQLVAVAVLRLADQHRLALDDSAARFVPALGARYAAVTVRQLLTHTSGIARVDDQLIARPPRNTAGVIAVIAAAPPAGAPGTEFAYNNANYHVLGAIIERLTGQRWDELLERDLFHPLEMKHTRACAARVSGRATGYIIIGGYRHPGTPLPPVATGAAAGICSSVEDLARWTVALHGGRLLDTATYRAMTTPVSGGDEGYGLGTMIGTVTGHRTIFHAGGTGSGARSLVAYFPDDSLTVVLLANAEPVDLDRVEAAITAAWYGAPEPSSSH